MYVRDVSKASEVPDLCTGPNNYSVPGMLGKTVQSSKVQCPGYTLSGRTKVGSFDQDLQKVW